MMDPGITSTALVLQPTPDDEMRMATNSGLPWRGELLTKGRTIQCIECVDPPFPLPEELHMESKMKEAALFNPVSLKSFEFSPLGVTPGPVHRWREFANYLLNNEKVGVVLLDDWELFIPPPATRPQTGMKLCVYYRPKQSPRIPCASFPETAHCFQPSHVVKPGVIMLGSLSPTFSGWTTNQPTTQVRQLNSKGAARPRGTHVHPSHLETLEQMHSAWIFGGIAELIDNARDAKATRLDISLENMCMEGKTVQVLQVVDNGHGMDHDEIVRMLSFGHKRPEETDKDQIGHFGVGFKTGAMRLGSDALVLTQSKETCSMGFMSKSYNSNFEVLEIPIVTYKRFPNGLMELDESIQSKEEEEICKKAISKHSPLQNDLSIGVQFAKIESKGKTGTRIFVYNLDRWEGECVFECTSNHKEGTGTLVTRRQELKDLQIRSQRVRARSGQTSLQVPLDYSLRAYVEVLFLVPRMRIFIQGTPVDSIKLADSLHKAQRFRYSFTDEKDSEKKMKQVVLTLGKRQEEFDRSNCGIFLYWHGRLIEDFGNGKVGVLNSKQGFTDSDKFSKLEKWLGKTFDKYWDDNFDQYDVVKADQLTEGEKLHPDNHWVQCNKCSKWRMMPKGWDSDSVEGDWFCYMKPFEKNCKVPETKHKGELYTVAMNRNGTQSVAAVPVVNGSDTSIVSNTDTGSEDSSSSSDGVLARFRRPSKPPARGLSTAKNHGETVSKKQKK